MTQLNALIIDDEPLAHKIILEYVKEIPYLNIIGQCHLATEAFSFLNTGKVDLIFLDINMPKLKGLDFLRTLNKRPIVIITSAYGEYALESFELDVCDYLLKPFRFDRFMKATNKALEIYGLKNNAPQESIPTPKVPEEAPKNLFIKSDKRLIQINPLNIFLLESYGNYVKIWLNKEYHLTPGTLSSFEDQLSATQFFRTHKSFIINRSYIDYIEGNSVVMKNEMVCPIGKNNRQDFKKFVQG